MNQGQGNLSHDDMPGKCSAGHIIDMGHVDTNLAQKNVVARDFGMFLCKVCADEDFIYGRMHLVNWTRKVMTKPDIHALVWMRLCVVAKSVNLHHELQKEGRKANEAESVIIKNNYMTLQTIDIELSNCLFVSGHSYVHKVDANTAVVRFNPYPINKNKIGMN